MLVGGYRLGAKVFITGRRQADLDKTVVEIGGDITAVQNAAAYRKGAQDEPNERAVTDHIARRHSIAGGGRTFGVEGAPVSSDPPCAEPRA